MYAAVKILHVTLAAISIAGFIARGLLALRASPLLQLRWVRVAPHVNDTLLLSAGVTLSVMSRQYPFVDAWITAKLAAVVAYILLGALALRPGRGAAVRLASGLAALIVASYIVFVAITKSIV